MNLADFMAQAGIKKHPFGNSGFTGVNVRNDADVSNFGERAIRRHKNYRPTEMGRTPPPAGRGLLERAKCAKARFASAIL